MPCRRMASRLNQAVVDFNVLLAIQPIRAKQNGESHRPDDPSVLRPSAFHEASSEVLEWAGGAKRASTETR